MAVIQMKQCGRGTSKRVLFSPAQYWFSCVRSLARSLVYHIVTFLSLTRPLSRRVGSDLVTSGSGSASIFLAFGVFVPCLARGQAWSRHTVPGSPSVPVEIACAR